MTPLRTFVLTLLLLTTASVSIAPSAAAQQMGSLTILLDAPVDSLNGENVVVFTGTAKLVVDFTAYATAWSGIPVQYALQAPEWATAVVSPSSDVFQLPTVPSQSVTMVRPFTITVSAGDLDLDQVSTLTLIAHTAPGGPFSQSFTGMGSTSISYDAPDKPEEPCTVLTDEQKAALLAEGAAMYNSYQEQQDAPSARDEGDVSVQNTGATLMPSPWVGVAAFGLVGAGVGLFLRRKLRA